jgi:mono/diheme cytochrome c family protein
MNRKRIPILPLALTGVVIVVFFVLWAGNDFQSLRSKEPPIQVRSDMYYQTKVSAQQPATFFADRAAMRPAVPGTVPRDGAQYAYTTWQQADSALVNPIPAPTREILARGENRFNSFCSPCHSTSGQDTTEVVRRGMQKPPNLLLNAPKYSDARIFHIISAGQNIMPSYADKLVPADRWAVVAWVRELQKAAPKYPLLNPATPATAGAAPNGGGAQAPSASTPAAGGRP